MSVVGLLYSAAILFLHFGGGVWNSHSIGGKKSSSVVKECLVSIFPFKKLL
jgi:hypothetical protein